MAKNAKLPKHVAGIKVPRRLRKPGGKTLQALRHPLVADLAAAAIISAAARTASNERLKKASCAAKRKAGHAIHAAGAGAASLGTIIAAKARDGSAKLSAAYQLLGEGNGQSAGNAKSRSGRKSSASSS